jgi:hypothetical protein
MHMTSHNDVVGNPDHKSRSEDDLMVTRNRSHDKTTAALILTHTIRAIAFVAFAYGLWTGILNSLFALVAGIGDLVIGVAAIPVAFAIVKRYQSTTRMAITWNILGMIDLVLAIGLGLGINIAAMSTFPWIIIPTIGVPSWLAIHGILLRRLFKEQSRIKKGRSSIPEIQK